MNLVIRKKWKDGSVSEKKDIKGKESDLNELHTTVKNKLTWRFCDKTGKALSIW